MISVCIATYNGENYIRQQLMSILPQLSEDDEIVVSDDHSRDRTNEVILSINDPRIHLFTHDATIEPIFTIDRSTLTILPMLYLMQKETLSFFATKMTIGYLRK